MGIWNAFKTIAVPALVGTLRTVSSAGSALFGMLNVFKYFHQEDHPAEAPASYLAIGVNAATTVTTTVPYLFRQFRDKNQQPAHERTNEKKEIQLPFFSCCGSCGYCSCHENMSVKAKVTHTLLKDIGLIAGGFMSLGFYLGGVTFSEFIRRRIYDVNQPIEEWETWEIAAVLSFASACAVSNYVTFYSNRYQKIKTSAKNAADIIDHGGNIWNAETAKALGLSLPNLISVPFISYFSTSNALLKIPFVQIPAPLDKILAITSAVTSLPTTILADIPVLYDYLKKRKSTIEARFAEPAWEPFTRTGIYILGGTDALTSVFLTTFVGMVHTSSQAFHIDPYSWKLIVPSLVCAASKTANGFFFYVYRGYHDTLTDYHLQRGDVPYESIDKINAASSKKPDIESGIYQGSSSTLFPIKTEQTPLIIANQSIQNDILPSAKICS